jgi:hypothetical protein
MLDQTIGGALEMVLAEFSELQGTYITRPHIFHSLLCALIHNRFDLIGAADATGLQAIGKYYEDHGKALTSLKRLAAAHEERDLSEFGEYVQAASEGGNRANQRTDRIKWLCRALRGEFA